MLLEVQNVLEKKEEARPEQNLNLEDIFDIESNLYGNISAKVTKFAERKRRSFFRAKR